MNIKQTITALIIVFGVSFNAYSQVYKVTGILNNSSIALSCLGVQVGDVFDSSSTSCKAGTSFENGTRTWTANSVSFSNIASVSATRNGSTYIGEITITPSSCPSPKEINPANGLCEELEPCPSGYERNELGVCVPVEPSAFCETEFLELDAQQYLSCANENKDNFFNYTSYCNSEDDYAFNCAAGIDKPTDPTQPIDAPNGDFNGGSGGTATPDAPNFDKPEPDSPTPDNNTDTAVMEAIRNLNRDNNAALKGINEDMNKGFTDVNNQLTELNGTNKALGQSVVDQMKKDHEYYLANKELSLQQTNAIASGFTSVSGAIATNTSTLKGAIQSQTAVIKGALDSSTSVLGNKLDSLEQTIKDNRPCHPDNNDRSCEGQSGMTEQFTSTVNEQINTAVETQFKDTEKKVTNAVQSYIDDSKLAPMEGYMHEAANIALKAMPDINDCTPFSIPSIFGGRIDFGCEFSVQFKAVASFIIYIYTLWTLIDILLNGVTPAAGTVPYMSRRM